jgi:hypothetical protein
MNTTRAATHPATTARLSSLTLAALLTLSMLLGVHALAQHDSPAPQLAQAAATKA